MDLKITGRHYEIKESARTYFEEEMGAILPHVENVTKASVVIEKIKHNFNVEIIVHSHHKDFVAKANSDSMGKSFHLAATKLVKQMEKQFSKENGFPKINIREVTEEELV